MNEVEFILACLAAVAAIIVAMEYTPNRYIDYASPIYVIIAIFSVEVYMYIAGGIK